mgnify:CR=1 FL=1
MRALFRIILVTSFLTLTTRSFAQYEGLDSNRRQIKEMKKTDEVPFADEIVAYRYRDLKYSGADITAFGYGGVYSLEISPYTGLQFDNKIYAAVGLSAGFYQSAFRGISTLNAATFGFVRIPINSIFIHAEYRYQNALIDISPNKRGSYGTGIFGVGYADGSELNSYFLIGFASNPKYSITSSLGSIIYRFGFRF